MILRLVAIISWLAFTCAHSQIKDASCESANGVIRVENPAISGTYWLENTICVFLLDHYAKPVDVIGITRSTLPMVAGTVTLPGKKPLQENLTVHGEGEPFAMLPMYKTKTLNNVLAANVTVSVTGRAMVSFGMAEDPALVFGEVLTDAYRSRQWVYNAPYELLYINFGLLAIVIAVAVIGTGNWQSHFSCVPWLEDYYAEVYKKNKRIANVTYLLAPWIIISVVTDHFIWVIWVWVRINDGGAFRNFGGAFFVIVFFVRLLFYAYLCYVLTEQNVKHLSTWRIVSRRRKDDKDSKKRRCKRFMAALSDVKLVPFLVGGALTGYVFAWLYMGREAFEAHQKIYYIVIPALVGMFLWALPVVAAEKAEKVDKTNDPTSWETIYVTSFCLSHLTLVTLLGIVLNVGLGMLAPLCLLLAFWKRRLGAKVSHSYRSVEMVPIGEGLPYKDLKF